MISVDHPTGRPNFYIVSTPGYRVAFSYKTLVGVNPLDGRGWIVRQNDWGPTTGKHLNWLDDGDKQARVADSEFQAILADTVG